MIYRGTFSVGADMPIGDLSLEAFKAQGPPGLRQARVEASSLAYPLIETLFPIRYRFRSWTLGDQGHLLGLESYERIREVRHRLYLRDSHRAIGRFRVGLNKGRAIEVCRI